MSNKSFPRSYKLHIKRSRNKQFFGILVAPNGETMDHTETMTTKSAVKKNFLRKQKAYATAVIVDDTVVIKKAPVKKAVKKVVSKKKSAPKKKK